MPKSIAYNRHMRMLDILNHKGELKVGELSNELGVSVVTVRRDLDYLDQEGMIMRTHGGAFPVKPSSEVLPESEFIEKGILAINEKRRIAEKAAELMTDEEILFMNSGTSTLFFLQALKDKRIRVITNNAAAISMEYDSQVELMFLGGEYRERSRSFVGEFALNTIKTIYSSHTILGTNALSLEQGLTTAVYRECNVNQAMIDNTKGNVIVLADYTKMGKVSNFVSASLNQVNIVVTDDKSPDKFVGRLEEMGIKVIIA